MQQNENDSAATIAPLTSSECVADLLLAGHAVRVRVQGRSMNPLIPDGTVLTLAPVTASALRLGDVALYRSPDGRLICHRLLARRRIAGTTKLGFRGDAFTIPLEWIEATGIMAKAVQRGGVRLDRPARRWAGWLYAWGRWIISRTRIKLGSWRRRIMCRH